MHYPVDVFIGKIRDYDGSRPSAIAKVQIDGELELTDLGLQGDEQAEKRFTAALTARYAIILASITPSGREISRNRPRSSTRRHLGKTSRRKA